jgi:hypothetical protein
MKCEARVSEFVLKSPCVFAGAQPKQSAIVNKNNLLCEDLEFWLDELLEGAIAALVLLLFSSFLPVL